MNLEEKIEELRETLNRMLDDKESYEYQEILEVSTKLDELIYRFYTK